MKINKFPLFSFFLISTLLFQTSFPAFLAPVTKDFAKKKYRYGLSIYLKTPPQTTNLLLDLGASFTLLDCFSDYTSKTSRPVPCGSSLCSSLGSTCTDSPNHTCALRVKKSVMGEARVDMLHVHVTDGRNPGRLGYVPEFMFSCTHRSLLKGLIKGTAGLAGFGRSTMSLPAQVSASASEDSVFALCLSGSPSAPGVAFFGTSGPYYFYPEIDLSKHLNYTRLLSYQVGSTVISYANPSNEYFVGLTSIRVNGKPIDFDRRILSIDHKGHGGTKLSTITPYTVLHSKIYKALTEAFVKESAVLNLTVTEPVEPFKICYEAEDVLSTRTGPGVPTVDLVLEGEDVIWRIFGENSMVRIFRDGGDVDVWCLGVLDGGSKPKTSIVIGGHQMEDNLLQFDLKSKRLGFSSSVLVHGTRCANFNFTMNSSLYMT